MSDVPTGYAVVLTDGSPDKRVHHVWGPFTTRPDADRFAAFVTAEIDPCVVVPTWDPIAELLNWHENKREGFPTGIPYLDSP